MQNPHFIIQCRAISPFLHPWTIVPNTKPTSADRCRSFCNCGRKGLRSKDFVRCVSTCTVQSRDDGEMDIVLTNKRSRRKTFGFLLVSIGLVASALAGFFLASPLAIFLLVPAAFFIAAIGADDSTSRAPMKGTQYISTNYGPQNGLPLAREADQH